LRVEDAMHSVDVPIVGSDATVREGLAFAEEQNAAEILVDDPPFGWCSLNTEKLRALDAQGKGRETIAHNLAAKRMPQIYPDNRLEVALRHIGQWPFLPVMHRADPRQLVGLISMRDVMGAFVE
jgi:CBS domain-containing protein